MLGRLKFLQPTGTFDLHRGQASAFAQVRSVETQQQPQIPLSVNEWRGQAAQVWSGDGLLVRL